MERPLSSALIAEAYGTFVLTLLGPTAITVVVNCNDLFPVGAGLGFRGDLGGFPEPGQELRPSAGLQYDSSVVVRALRNRADPRRAGCCSPFQGHLQGRKVR